MTNPSILKAFERFYQRILDIFADKNHNHDDKYYTESEVDTKFDKITNNMLRKIELTQAEYDALTEKDPSVIYIITDKDDADYIGEDLLNKILDPDNYPLTDEVVESTSPTITLEIGKLSRTSGAERDGEGGLRTPDFIAVSAGENVYPVYEELSSEGTFCFFLYDSSYNFISTLWNDGYCYCYIDSGRSFTIPSDIGAAYLKGYISVDNAEGTLTLKDNNSQSVTRAEHKKIYIADHGYSIYGDTIDDDETMHKFVIRAEGKDDNVYNITEIKAPSDNPQEATITLMNSGNGVK